MSTVTITITDVDDTLSIDVNFGEGGVNQDSAAHIGALAMLDFLRQAVGATRPEDCTVITAQEH